MGEKELPGACDDCALASGCSAYHTCVCELGWIGVGCRDFKPRPESRFGTRPNLPEVEKP